MDKFKIGDIVVAKRTIKFPDGTKHWKGSRHLNIYRKKEVEKPK